MFLVTILRTWRNFLVNFCEKNLKNCYFFRAAIYTLKMSFAIKKKHKSMNSDSFQAIFFII